jgi:hypothetical protein
MVIRPVENGFQTGQVGGLVIHEQHGGGSGRRHGFTGSLRFGAAAFCPQCWSVLRQIWLRGSNCGVMFPE